MSRRLIGVVFWVWLAGILFPMAFAVKYWPSWQQIFDAVFAPAWMHVVMHFSLYAVLAVLGAHVLLMRGKNVLWAFGVVVLAGVLQEGLQVVTQGGWPGWGAELFDLGVDLAGGILGLIAAYAGRKKKKAPLGASSGGEGGI